MAHQIMTNCQVLFGLHSTFHAHWLFTDAPKVTSVATLAQTAASLRHLFMLEIETTAIHG